MKKLRIKNSQKNKRRKRDREEQVEKFKYLGSMLIEDWRCEEREIKGMIAIDQKVFNTTKRFCSNKNVEMRN